MLKEILGDIESGRYKKLYLLYGEEAYLRQYCKNKLYKALVPEGDTMNCSRFTGKGIDVAEVIGLCETLPFFAEHRVVFLEDTECFKSANEELADYLKNLPDYLVMVFSEETVDKRTRLYKAASQAGMVVEFTRQTPESLAGWIAGNMKREGKKISQPDARYLVEKIGDEMGSLQMEMEKLTAYTAGRGVVTREDIDAICTTRLQDRIFDMIRAVANHDQKKALDLYDDLLALKVAPIKILVLMGRQYTQLLSMHELLGEGLPQKELAAKIGVAPFAVRELDRCARKYSQTQLQDALRWIMDTDESIKTGQMMDTLGVELLLVQLSQAAG